MPRIDHDRPMPRAVVFDLDETLLDRRPAWRYALEQAVISVSGAHVDAGALVDDYHNRPVSHAIAILVGNPQDRAECQRHWREVFYRSALKRLLVQEGVGMGLDRLRGARVEIGAISREPHVIARRQVESTGLERFVAALSATPEGTAWAPAERLADCLGFLGYPPAECAFISANPDDLEAAAAAGWRPFSAGWIPDMEQPVAPVIASALETAAVLGGAWRAAAASSSRPA